jgi:hypothetical protein
MTLPKHLHNLNLDEMLQCLRKFPVTGSSPADEPEGSRNIVISETLWKLILDHMEDLNAIGLKETW